MTVMPSLSVSGYQASMTAVGTPTAEEGLLAFSRRGASLAGALRQALNGRRLRWSLCGGFFDARAMMLASVTLVPLVPLAPSSAQEVLRPGMAQIHPSRACHLAHIAGRVRAGESAVGALGRRRGTRRERGAAEAPVAMGRGVASVRASTVARGRKDPPYMAMVLRRAAAKTPCATPELGGIRTQAPLTGSQVRSPVT
ncbi:hypothetical protein GCM10010231_65090 [Streptomyces sindenensis]|nr:hypothetical protein GCM10010231_65090 [Streptomyces sindenensis]